MCDDYTDQFAEKVVAIIGPVLTARMQNIAHNAGATNKKIEPEQGTGA